MSKFREKAAAIKEAGIAERGNFTPNGVPLRMYNWWLDNSPSDKAELIKNGHRKENFCHFWRVVLIWTPLLWSFVHVAEKLTSIPGMLAVGVIAFLVLSAVLTTTGSWLEFFAFVGIGFGGMAALIGLALGGSWLSTKYDWFVPVILGTVAAGALGFVLVAGFMDLGFMLFAYIAAVAAVIAVGFFIAAKASDWVAGRRALRAAETDAAYDAWIKGDGPNPFDVPTREANWLERKLGAFFSGLGDFLVLVSQVVRVKKWGICPLVEIEKTEVDTLV